MIKPNKVFRSIAVAVTLSCALPVFAETTQDGVAAATDGRFEDAKQIWEDVGDAAALRNLGGLYLSGVLGSTDLEKALQYFQQSADMGDAQAMLSLGHMYANGMGVDVNAAVAESWFGQAANAGLPEGEFMWARSVLDRGASPDETQKALNFLTSASEAGLPAANYAIGDLLRTGTYTDQDVQRALLFYSAAGDSGMTEAFNTLGDIYLFAELGAPDISQAIEYYRKAAEQGNTTAMYSLAFLFYSDPGADEQLLSSAFNFAQSAAMAWDEQAQLLLGRMYLDDRAVPRDNAQAYFWLDLAASAGVVEAHHIRALAFAGLGETRAAAIHDEARRWFDENHAVPHTHRLLGSAAHNFK